MAGFSDYMENEILSWMCKGAAFESAPATLYVDLHTANPGDAGTASVITGTDYARADITANSEFGSVTAAGTNAAVGRSVSSSADITFATAGSNWGTASHFSIWDHATAGNCLATGALGSSVTINQNTQLRIPSGDLTITVT
mgnify:CR=1 FL=1